MKDDYIEGQVTEKGDSRGNTITQLSRSHQKTTTTTMT